MKLIRYKLLFLSLLTSLTILPFTFADVAPYLPPPADFALTDELETFVTDSFSHRDHNGSLAIDQFNESGNKQLEEYSGLNNFEEPSKKMDSHFPWRQGPFLIDGKEVAKLNLNNPQHAKLFSKLVYIYILEGWFTSKTGQMITDTDQQFRNNHSRTWCTTPGVVDGKGGREAVHGLTKELGLKPNPLYPAKHGVDSFNEELWDSANKLKRPAGWGQPFFNAVVCDKYKEVFGKIEDNQLPKMNDQALLRNQPGFVSFKLHFNAMSNWQNYQPFDGAYTWIANVGNTRGQQDRKLQEIPLIQISVSMKLDPRFIDGLESADGTKKADDWVMLAFYHDANFNKDVPPVTHLPEALKMMRPMGIQTGFTPADTIMFQGAKSNHKANTVDTKGNVTGHIWHPNDSNTLLNGPADNAYSSCMGCHAGFSYMDKLKASDPRRGGADSLSFFDVDTFNRVRKEHGTNVDFNLQLYNAFNRIKAWVNKTTEESEPSY